MSDVASRVYEQRRLFSEKLPLRHSLPKSGSEVNKARIQPANGLSQKYLIEQLSHSHRRFSAVIKGSDCH
jgi:hypothetical protein